MAFQFIIIQIISWHFIVIKIISFYLFLYENCKPTTCICHHQINHGRNMEWMKWISAFIFFFSVFLFLFLLEIYLFVKFEIIEIANHREWISCSNVGRKEYNYSSLHFIFNQESFNLNNIDSISRATASF